MCIWNSTFKHTAWSTSLLPREAVDAGLAQFDFTPSVSRKNWHAHFRDRGWRRLRYLPPKKRGDMATETVVALDSNLKLLLMSKILVAVEKMVASCYNRDNMGPTWGRQDSGGPHVGHMNLAIWDGLLTFENRSTSVQDFMMTWLSLVTGWFDNADIEENGVQVRIAPHSTWIRVSSMKKAKWMYFLSIWFSYHYLGHYAGPHVCIFQ